MADETLYELPDPVAVEEILFRSEDDFAPYKLSGFRKGDTFKMDIKKWILGFSVAYIDTPEKCKVRLGFYENASDKDKKALKETADKLAKIEKMGYQQFKASYNF